VNSLSKGRLAPETRFSREQENMQYLRHLAAYDFAKKFVEGKTVLEVGCGTGYGAHYLFKFAREIQSVDISNEAILYAQNQFNKTNLYFRKISGNELPFDDVSFNIALSFQVIEHIEKSDVARWLSEKKEFWTIKGF